MERRIIRLMKTSKRVASASSVVGKKILVANRSEIAIRVFRAATELGMRTVAIYAQEDRLSMHRFKADEAYEVGEGKGPVGAYLDIEGIVGLAKEHGVDMIHPGYGFLSENAEFAKACEDAGITFVGPRSELLAEMGDKTAARALAQKLKVPTLPGTEDPLVDRAAALKIAKSIGFPLIIKAAFGGGGRGMRVVMKESELASLLDEAQGEAGRAFGNPAVLLEKYIPRAKHIEVQILGDNHGHVLHLHERDCSVQRRHQKVIEVAPSIGLKDKIRRELCHAAVRIAEGIGYNNAGTIEFLVDKNGKFYFMEMNTRIQVEHGVTEEVTDIDLVRRQILIACGEKLELNQKDIKITGHAIECRINAEDPARNFAPSPGTIGLYYTPGGHGVRVDSHCYSGYTIPPTYDSMVAKLISVGANRQKALDRMHRALGEYIIRGIHTTIPVCRSIMKDPVFRQGGATTKYLEDFFERTPKELWSASPLS